MAALVVTTGFTSCSEDDLDTNQYNKSGVNILGFGPMPITRGETMRLTGTKLDKVREVLFPEGNQKLTPATTFIKGDFTVQNSEEMTVTIPDLCVPGKLRVVTESGDTIKSASSITFAEEVKVASFSPTSIHPGDILTIKGEYVWNIGQVVFFDHVTVDAEDFVRNTRNEIQVRVPMEAKSGEVAYNDGSDGAENTVIGNLSVDAAKATGVSNANPEFNETITITGENLDLVTSIDFPAVEDVSFSIRKGETLALVGHSGAGKTTCANLLLRYWDVDSGSITVGGVDLRDMSLNNVRDLVSAVLQDVYLFNIPIKENIRLGSPEATDEDIVRAAKLACAHDFIMSLPDGYDTNVGERGANISGGQRQRIAIARAILKDSPILILDEAVSNLDTENEKEIQQALKEVSKDRTTLVIAHRLSTIMSADKILVLDKGKVVQSGTHEELIRQEGIYRTLVSAQMDQSA